MNELILTERSNIVAIADAVRNKTGITGSMNLGNIVSAIDSISQSAAIDLDAELTEQDTVISQIQAALEGKASASPIAPILQDKTVTPSANT